MQFGLGPGNGFRVFQTNLEGQDVELTDTLLALDGQPWFDPTGRAMLAVDGNNCNPGYRDNFTPLTVAFYDSGVILVACVYQRGSEHYINFRIQVPRSYSRRTRGFLGNFDSVRTNEFYRRGSSNAEDETKFGNLYNHPALEDVMKTCKNLGIAIHAYTYHICSNRSLDFYFLHGFGDWASKRDRPLIEIWHLCHYQQA